MRRGGHDRPQPGISDFQKEAGCVDLGRRGGRMIFAKRRT
nr:MAG TPA: hypothetical protein [Caudoviricetes sp.]